MRLFTFFQADVAVRAGRNALVLVFRRAAQLFPQRLQLLLRHALSVVAHDKVTAAFLQKAFYGNFRPPPLGFTAMNDRVFPPGAVK